MLGRPDRRIQAELANAGFGLMFGGGIILCAAILMLLQAGLPIATTMIVGGLARLILALHLPGEWNSRWAQYIYDNSFATAKEVYQFAGRLMDEFGLSGLPIVPYR